MCYWSSVLWWSSRRVEEVLGLRVSWCEAATCLWRVCWEVVVQGRRWFLRSQSSLKSCFKSCARPRKTGTNHWKVVASQSGRDWWHNCKVLNLLIFRDVIMLARKGKLLWVNCTGFVMHQLRHMVQWSFCVSWRRVQVMSDLSSKTWVAPLSEQTITRLELLSAVVLSRLIHSVNEALSSEMKIDKLFCWTDSKIAWYWIVQSQKEWKPFVQHRVDEIRKLVPEECWNHCPGADNPADLLSRGMNCRELETRAELFKAGLR